MLTRRSRAKLGDNYNMLTVGGMLYKKKQKKRVKRILNKESNMNEDFSSDGNLNSNNINLNSSSGINNGKWGSKN